MIISGKTKTFGLIGSPVENSYSPFIYNEAFKITDFDGVYSAFNIEPDKLSEAIMGIKGLGISGVNVTAPYKERVIHYLNHISQVATTIGAVNTIINKNGQLWGFNTDYIGFLKQLFDLHSEFMQKESWKVTLFGAGGAARSVIFSLLLFFDYLPSKYIYESNDLLKGCIKNILKEKKIDNINIINRDQKKAMNLKSIIDELTEERKILVNTIEYNPDGFTQAVETCDLFINATSLGFKGCPALDDLIQPELFSKDQMIIDLVYNAEEKSFIEYGKRSGAKIFSGLDMLIYQAEASFYLFTGQRISFDPIRKSIREKFE